MNTVAPVAKAKRGKGPRTKRAMRRQRLAIEAHRLQELAARRAKNPNPRGAEA